MISLFKSVPTGDEYEAIKHVMESGWWDKGPKVAELEQKFADFVGAKYAIATNSCTAALDIAVRMLPYDTFTVSPLTFVSSASCVINAGKKVEFVDIDPLSLCTPQADIQVLYAGNDFGEGTIYDMAHFGGGKHKGLMSCWSFQARKNLPTGDGGMLTTNNEEIAQRARAISWYGVNKSTYDRSQKKYSWDYEIKEVGIKGNMNDITAAIGLCQLEKLPQNNVKRALIASWYDQYLPQGIKRPFHSATWHMYVIRVPERDKVYDFMAENGVTCGVHYKPLYKYPIFPQTELPNTEQAFKEILTLPMHVDLTEDDVKEVCRLLSIQV